MRSAEPRASAALRAWPNASAYHASKWGLLGLSHALHAELRPQGIKVSAIVAGGMRPSQRGGVLVLNTGDGRTMRLRRVEYTSPAVNAELRRMAIADPLLDISALTFIGRVDAQLAESVLLDAEVVRDLAALELRDSGMAVPAGSRNA